MSSLGSDTEKQRKTSLQTLLGWVLVGGVAVKNRFAASKVESLVLGRNLIRKSKKYNMCQKLPVLEFTL